ncbi:unnamed protein product [Prorocentrum cordatum]|uniref:Uncharacterized protein n=1 Tax=Prorocentrum cordatum TaxID=2364126 RepID=A0ABN9PDS5_9DINO|nr:unnamed protein product [Polarella glacialis]
MKKGAPDRESLPGGASAALSLGKGPGGHDRGPRLLARLGECPMRALPASSVGCNPTVCRDIMWRRRQPSIGTCCRRGGLRTSAWQEMKQAAALALPPQKWRQEEEEEEAEETEEEEEETERR